MADQCECPPGAGSDTCEAHGPKPTVPCPTNGRPGKRVDSITVKALLARPLTDIEADTYLFCGDPNCPTVYYSEDGSQLFTESDLRERVFQKHPLEDGIFACYCFRHTVGAITSEVLSLGRSTVPDAINAGIQADKCACDIRNPQGSCCLGNVRMLVRSLQAPSTHAT